MKREKEELPYLWMLHDVAGCWMMLPWEVWKGWHLKIGLRGDKADIMVMSISSERQREGEMSEILGRGENP